MKDHNEKLYDFYPILFFVPCCSTTIKSGEYQSSIQIFERFGLNPGCIECYLEYFVIHIEEINQLNTSDIWKFERKLTENWDKKSITASDAFLYTSICNPVLLYLQKDIRKDVFPVSLIWLETMTLNLGLTNLTKTLLSRKRPYLYGNKASLTEKQKNDNQRSFFSGHTSTAAASWFMLAKIYQDYYPQDKRLPYIWSFSAVVPAITAYLRVKGGKHFYTDVITGYLVGAAVGLIVPELHKTDNRFSTGMAMLPNGQLGMGIYFVINTNL